MDKYTIRRVAAVFALLGFTGSVGALLSGNSLAGGIILTLIAINVLVIAHD